MVDELTRMVPIKSLTRNELPMGGREDCGLSLYLVV